MTKYSLIHNGLLVIIDISESRQKNELKAMVIKLQ